MNKRKILIIDDDISHLKLMEAHLKNAGYELSLLSDPTTTAKTIESFMPDLVIVDLMMPVIDGFSIIKAIREKKEFAAVRIIVVSAKAFPHDEARAYELGAHAYVVKPINFPKLKDLVAEVFDDETKITFWGTRGTFPTPYSDFLTYGGNTPCVSVQFPRNRFFIFDAGTGIIPLGDKLAAWKKNHKINICISHPHWDHIHGFPFFKPAFGQGNEIAIFGSSHGDISLREVMSGQMESIYFPITIRAFAARVYFRELREGTQNIDSIAVSTIMLNHPGNTLGYRLTDISGKSVAYVTDNELIPESAGAMDPHFRKKLVSFLEGVDVLIHDSSYFDDEYKSHFGWGHPPISEVLRLGADAKVKNLYLFHHDPGHNDARIAEKEAFARRYVGEHGLDMQVFAATENKTVKL